ncbi:unnamed protein product [Leptosia nina]|uniref:Uncharacterized protein n=1 Tax=Leptosia nina TaxID=320188 RepID=A0AAV1JQ61_9NEOP
MGASFYVALFRGRPDAVKLAGQCSCDFLAWTNLVGKRTLISAQLSLTLISLTLGNARTHKSETKQATLDVSHKA